MRIVYLIPAPMGSTPEGADEIERRKSLLQSYAAGGTTIDVADVDEGPLSIESMYEEYLSIPGGVQRAVDLEKEGWDALILGCYGDPGLDAYRELLTIPVIGPGEATALMAASLGRRFSIVTVTESIVPAIERLVRNAGVSEKLASVKAVEIAVLDLRKDLRLATEAVLEAGRQAIREDGADTLVLGCMSMGFLGIAEAVGLELGLPVLNPCRVSVRFAEALLGAGLTHSRRAYRTPPKMVSAPSMTLCVKKRTSRR